MSVDEPYVHIVFNWRADATDDWEIRYCRSNDCGKTWPVWTQLTNNDTSSLYPDVAARGSYVHVTYQDDWAGNFEVMYKRITNYGAGAVDQTRRLTFSDSDSYLPQIAVSMSGLSVNIVYEDTIDTTLDIFYKHIYSSGAGPYDTRRITFGIYQEDYNSFSDIATSSGTDDQFVYIVYNGHWPGNSEIMYKRLDNWGQGGFIMYSARLTYSSTVSSMAAIAFDSIHNDVHISYLDYWPGNSDVMHRKLPDYGGDGYSAQRISWGSGDSNYSSIASSDVWTFVAWSDNTSGNYEIYFKRGT